MFDDPMEVSVRFDPQAFPSVFTTPEKRLVHVGVQSSLCDGTGFRVLGTDERRAADEQP
jgi:hypothetical protein